MQIAVVIGSVIFTSITAPLFLAYLTNRSRRVEKKDDWARQDEVAARAVEVARLLVQNNELVATSATETQAQLKVIHTLVNSNMTASMQGELDQARATLVLLRRTILRDEDAGIASLDDDLAAITSTEETIAKLEAELADRLRTLRDSETPDP